MRARAIFLAVRDRWIATVLSVVAPAAGASSEVPGITVRSDVRYLAADRAEKLDLYLPAGHETNGRAPAVVWIHRGGWTGGGYTLAADAFTLVPQ